MAKFKRPTDELADLCAICGKPIVPHVDAVYSIPTKEGKYRHYDCWDKHHNPRTLLKELREKLSEVEDKLDRLKRR